MITKEDLKKEIDNIPENLLDKAYFLLRRVIFQKKGDDKIDYASGNNWKKWKNNLDKFTPDFMDSRDQPSNQIRESFD